MISLSLSKNFSFIAKMICLIVRIIKIIKYKTNIKNKGNANIPKSPSQYVLVFIRMKNIVILMINPLRFMIFESDIFPMCLCGKN